MPKLPWNSGGPLPSWYAYWDWPMADHKHYHQDFANAGYRLNSLSIYGPWWNTRVAAIWQKRGNGPDTWGAYYQEFANTRDVRRAEQIAKGRSPRLVAVFNDACGVPLYSEVFEEPDGVVETSYTVFDQQLTDLPDPIDWQSFRFSPHTAQISFDPIQNLLPRWLCLHENPTPPQVGPAGDHKGCDRPLYWSGVFEARKGNRTVPWNVTVDSKASFRTTYDAMIQAPSVRPEVIAIAPDTSLIATVWRGEYTDETLVPFEQTLILTKDEFEAKMAELEPQGYYPVRVHATSHWFEPYWDLEPVFVAVFARARKSLVTIAVPGQKHAYPDMVPLDRVGPSPESPTIPPSRSSKWTRT